MTSFDYVVLGIMALSVGISVVRGAVRELLSITAWVVSGYLALDFAAPVAGLLPSSLSSPTLRLATAFTAIFVVSLLLFALASLAVSALLKRSGLSATDRALGAVVGFARAIVILVVLTLVAGLTTLPHEPSWREARLSGTLESLAVLVRAHLPHPLASRISYD